MATSFVIVSATAYSREGFFARSPLGRSIEKLKAAFPFVDHDLAYSNSEGLPAVYNRAIDKHRALDTAHLLFVHDDVYLNDIFMFDKLEKGFETFDLIGIAGSACLNLDSPNVGWYACDPSFRAGGVVHPLVDRQDGQFYHVFYGVAPRECLVIDGVFMVLKTAAVGDVRFDEQFTFDFYDLDFCLALHRAGRKIATLPVLVTHLSVGAGFGRERFKIQEAKFLEKHGATGRHYASPGSGRRLLDRVRRRGLSSCSRGLGEIRLESPAD